MLGFQILWISFLMVSNIFKLKQQQQTNKRKIVFQFQCAGGSIKTSSHAFQTVSPPLENWSRWSCPLRGTSLSKYCGLRVLQEGSKAASASKHSSYVSSCSSTSSALLSLNLRVLCQCKEFPFRAGFLEYILAPMSASLRQKSKKTEVWGQYCSHPRKTVHSIRGRTLVWEAGCDMAKV